MKTKTTKTKMQATTKKNLLGILLILAAVTLLITGIFAFFSDSDDATAEGKAGTVDIEVEFDIESDVLANINPGDHDHNLATYLDADWSDITDGSEHPLGLTITNVGNKSVKVKNVIDLIVTLDDPDLTEDKFLFFLTSESDREETDASTKELAPDYYLFKNNPVDPDAPIIVTKWFDDTSAEVDDGEGYYAVDDKYEVIDSDNVSYQTLNSEFIGVRYISTSVMQGIGTGAENDSSIDGEAGPLVYAYYLGLKAEADNRYQGAEIEITCIVEAIQNRNTSDDAWTKISSATSTGKVPAKGEAADGTALTTTP